LARKRIKMKKITIELQASSGQLKSFIADLNISMLPWQKFAKYKIKSGGKIYKPQAASFKHQRYRPEREGGPVSSKP
jgi:hypothetical protein